jgi:hypothetical protein
MKVNRVAKDFPVVCVGGPPVDDEDLGQQGLSDRGNLTFGQRQAGLLLDQGQRFLRIPPPGAAFRRSGG